MFSKNGEDCCARIGRAGQAHTDLFVSSIIHILELPPNSVEVTEFRTTTERGDESASVAVRTEK